VLFIARPIYAFVVKKGKFCEMDMYPNVPKKRFYTAVKRLFDIVVSLFGIIVAALPMVVIALIVKLTSNGPVLFRQPRVGKGGKLFDCLKFRTMYTDAPNAMATCEFENPERFITGPGKILRKTSLDELPQLFNILKGDMSIVGPRPLIPKETEVHELRTSYGVYTIRPGLTGWAQVKGRDRLDSHSKSALDKYYVENRSFLLDFKILCFTVPKVLFGSDIVEGKKKNTKQAASQTEQQ
jgi:O-antigen biosynthesis protein WbqP